MEAESTVHTLEESLVLAIDVQKLGKLLYFLSGLNLDLLHHLDQLRINLVLRLFKVWVRLFADETLLGHAGSSKVDGLRWIFITKEFLVVNRLMLFHDRALIIEQIVFSGSKICIMSLTGNSSSDSTSVSG